ncbi:hypothetical protein [Amycolatopsis sp. NPDC051061]
MPGRFCSGLDIAGGPVPRVVIQASKSGTTASRREDLIVTS